MRLRLSIDSDKRSASNILSLAHAASHISRLTVQSSTFSILRFIVRTSGAKKKKKVPTQAQAQRRKTRCHEACLWRFVEFVGGNTTLETRKCRDSPRFRVDASLSSLARGVGAQASDETDCRETVGTVSNSSVNGGKYVFVSFVMKLEIVKLGTQYVNVAIVKYVNQKI